MLVIAEMLCTCLNQSRDSLKRYGIEARTVTAMTTVPLFTPFLGDHCTHAVRLSLLDNVQACSSSTEEYKGGLD